MFDSSMVTEPSGFEPLKFYCIAPGQEANGKSLDVSFRSSIQSNLNGSNIFGTMEIRSRHG